MVQKAGLLLSVFIFGSGFVLIGSLTNGSLNSSQVAGVRGNSANNGNGTSSISRTTYSQTGDSTSIASTTTIDSSTTISTSTTTSSSSSQSQNVWRRAIRLNTLGSHSSWTLGNYTAQQILGMLNDLQPTLLQRYVSGSQVPSRLVPVCSACSPMTAQQFLQSSEDISNSVIIARISL